MRRPEAPAVDEADLPDHPLVGAYVALLRAYRSNDLARLQTLFAPGVSLTIGGRSQFSGTYVGIGQVNAGAIALQRQFVPAASRILDVSTTDGELRAEVEVVAQHLGRRFPARLHHVVRFDADGRVEGFAIDAEDQDALDRFLG